jgi:hypothetical protein
VTVDYQTPVVDRYNWDGTKTIRARWLLVALLLIAATTGCTTRSDATDRTVSVRESASPADVISEATSFGGITLAPDDVVLDARTEASLDTRYELAIETDPDGLAGLLVHSGFDTPLIAASAPFFEVIAGPDLASSPSVLKAQDRFLNSENERVTRNIVVDERDDQTRYVHIELFTT